MNIIFIYCIVYLLRDVEWVDYMLKWDVAILFCETLWVASQILVSVTDYWNTNMQSIAVGIKNNYLLTKISHLYKTLP